MVSDCHFVLRRPSMRLTGCKSNKYLWITRYLTVDILMSHLLDLRYNISNCINLSLTTPPSSNISRHFTNCWQSGRSGWKPFGPRVIDSLAQIYLDWRSIQLLSLTKHFAMMEYWEHFREKQSFPNIICFFLFLNVAISCCWLFCNNEMLSSISELLFMTIPKVQHDGHLNVKSPGTLQ